MGASAYVNRPPRADPFGNAPFHSRRYVLLYGLVILCVIESASRMRIGSESSRLRRHS